MTLTEGVKLFHTHFLDSRECATNTLKSVQHYAVWVAPTVSFGVRHSDSVSALAGERVELTFWWCSNVAYKHRQRPELVVEMTVTILMHACGVLNCPQQPRSAVSLGDHKVPLTSSEA